MGLVQQTVCGMTIFHHPTSDPLLTEHASTRTTPDLSPLQVSPQSALRPWVSKGKVGLRKGCHL
ncbi:hypothetical protein COCON_G00151530 [Conger conger]|uniref:Uncharacterized protein n=1 Tax=Conger conger TaxID=82655 RepID=A0A9Q1D8A3_CONCO|nr:hypothetical protein COCON_G00151530 [Conger conger]